MHPDVFEVIRSAIFLGQKVRTIVKLARNAALAFWRVGAVKVRNVTISDVPEPVIGTNQLVNSRIFSKSRTYQ